MTTSGERDCAVACLDECTWVFDRVRVTPTIKHGARIEWTLHPQFADPGSRTFQLQVGTTGLDTADDWQDVGLSASDVFYMLDDTPRVFGKTQWIHYRIKMTTSAGVYYSTPQHAWGDLSFKYWQKLRNVIRLWKVKLTKTHAGQLGYLLKRKVTGAQPELGEGVLDYLTGEVVNPQAAETVGTEYIGGYYAAVPCIYAELDRVIRREHLDKTGMENKIQVDARMLAVPMIDSYDVWVDKDTDFRWAIHAIQHLVEVQGVPAVLQVKLRLLPFTDAVYQIEIADQLPA